MSHTLDSGRSTRTGHLLSFAAVPNLRQELKQNRPFSSQAEEVFLSVLRTADLFETEQARVLRGHKLSAPQYNVLRILRGAEPVGLPCQEIGARMVSRMPDVTRLLDRLESGGYVHRQRSETDRRVVQVRIREQGLALLAELDQPISSMSPRLLSGLDDEELGILTTLLAKARGTEASDDEPVPSADTASRPPAD